MKLLVLKPRIDYRERKGQIKSGSTPVHLIRAYPFAFGADAPYRSLIRDLIPLLSFVFCPLVATLLWTKSTTMGQQRRPKLELDLVICHTESQL
jgi:hypothetical protein